MAAFCSGFHMAWPSPSLPKVFSKEYPFNVFSEEASYIVLSLVLVDLIGRKCTLLLIGVPQIISMAMISLSFYSVVLLYVARGVGGIAEGTCFTTLPLYICEMIEPRVRGRLGGCFTLFFMWGLVFPNLVGYYLTIYIAALVYVGCSVCFMISFSTMPESPYYLLMKDKTEDARSSLTKLRACQDVEVELSSLSSDVKRQMSEKRRFIDLVAIESNKMACTVMIILKLLQQTSGISCFNLYSQILFKSTTDTIPQHWAAIIILVIQASTNIVAIILVDLVGRKPMLLISIGGCCATLTFNTVFFILKDFSSIDVTSLSVLPLAGLILFYICFALGLGCAVNLMLGELFPTAVKAKAASMMNMIWASEVLLSAKFYQSMVDNYSIVVPFALFAVCQFVGFILCVKFVPETKNKTLEQIQQELKRN